MIEQRIQQQFYDSADLQVQSAESLARPIADAANTVLGSITAGGKVLAFGLGASFADAQRFVAAFVGTFERDRPPLAALTLASDHAMSQTTGASHDSAGAAAKQLQALGAPGDVLLLIAAESMEASTLASLLALVQAAHDKDVTVVALTGRGDAAADASADPAGERAPNATPNLPSKMSGASVATAAAKAAAPTLSSVLTETDVLIAVPHARTARVQEIHALVLHCLCDAVDLQLMGEQELT